MGKVFQTIDDRLRDFIERQHLFFVATAPLAAGGHVNLSPPNIVRLHGTGRVVSIYDEEYAAWAPRFADLPGARAVIVVDVDRIADSCGWGVPLMSFEGDRELLRGYFERRGVEGSADYRRRLNRRSLDGLAAYDFDPLDEWSTLDGLAAIRQRLESVLEGWQAPAAYGVALGGDFPHVNLPGGRHRLPAVVLGTVLKHDGSTATIEMTPDQLAEAITTLAPAEACLEVEHPNLAAWRRVLAEAEGKPVTAVFVRSLDDDVTSDADAILRSSLSERPPPDNTGPVLVLVLLAIALLLVVAAAAGGKFSADGTLAPMETPMPTPKPIQPEPQPEPVPESDPEPGSMALPHGGDRVFDGRMLVAYYGTAGTGVLGVLGETSPDRAFERLVRAAAPFARNGKRAQPVFELIVTVADAHPGEGRDFSHDINPVRVLPYILAARRHGALLVLDLQPGRSDFLTVARRWEWALKYPWVGLALDPEWRMGGRQVPGRVVGSVSAAEINRTSAWLDRLAADNGLPQKLFLVHQFRTAMIRGLSIVARRAKLAMVQHIDGFGTPRQKLATYAAVAEPGQFRMGFKLFYDEDVRRLSARRVMQIRPRVDFVSFQ